MSVKLGDDEAGTLMRGRGLVPELRRRTGDEWLDISIQLYARADPWTMDHSQIKGIYTQARAAAAIAAALFVKESEK